MAKKEKVSFSKHFKKAYTGLATQVEWKEEGQIVEGEYVKLKEDVGKNKSKIYVLLKDNEYIAIWDSYQLDQAFAVIPFLSEVRIIYKGTSKLEGTNKTIKNFEVQYCEPEVKEDGANREVEETEKTGNSEKIPV